MSEYCEFEWNSTRHGYKIGSYIDTKNKNKKMNINWNEPTDRSCALIALRELIGASIDYALKDKSCCHDDEFLMRFLYARKFNVDEAFQLIINYHAYRQRNATILQRLSALDEPIQVSLRDGFPGVLKERDRRGRKILVFFAANWDHCTYSLISVYRAMLLSLEKLLDDKQNQANGFVAIVDWTNFTLRQSSHLNPKILKLMIEGLQDCFPVRFKAVHFIGQPWYVEAALAVIRPFLKEKTRARIKLHGSNLSTLHECIAREILPPELGGEGPAFNPLDWFHALLESSQTISTPRPYCITQPAVYSKPPSTYKKPSMLSNNNNSNHKNSNNNNHHNSNNNNNNNNSDPARNTLLGINDDLM